MSKNSLIEATRWSTKKGVTEGSAQNCYLEIAIAMSLSPKGMWLNLAPSNRPV